MERFTQRGSFYSSTYRLFHGVRVWELSSSVSSRNRGQSPLSSRQWPLRIYETWRISRVAQSLLTSQGGICSLQWVGQSVAGLQTSNDKTKKENWILHWPPNIWFIKKSFRNIVPYDYRQVGREFLCRCFRGYVWNMRDRGSALFLRDWRPDMGLVNYRTLRTCRNNHFI
jgi:hypothetical protein